MRKKNDGRGGKRPGSGRPKGDSKSYSFRVPGDIAKVIDSKEDKTAFIRHGLELAIEASNAPKLSFVTASQVESLKLPLFDIRIVAGFPIPLDNDEKSQDIDMLRLLCPHPESSYLIRVQGESMIDAGIESGDIVIVDKSHRNPSEKEIAVCELNGEYTLKHFLRSDKGHGWLVPANPDYPRIEVKESDDFSIWGTVTYIIHKARE